MDNRLDKFESKLDSIDIHVQTLAVSTAENTENLKAHMAQTLEVKTQTKMLGESLEAMNKHFEARINIHDKFKDRIITIFNTLCYIGVFLLGCEKLGLLKFLHLS